MNFVSMAPYFEFCPYNVVFPRRILHLKRKIKISTNYFLHSYQSAKLSLNMCKSILSNHELELNSGDILDIWTSAYHIINKSESPKYSDIRTTFGKSHN